MAEIPLQSVLDAVRAHRAQPRSDGDVEGAVLVSLTRDAEATLLLTQRAPATSRFPGEISFPGGYRQAGDADLRETALREAWEEVNVPPDRVEVVGRLDDRYVYGRTHVRPFVGVIGSGVEVRADPREVAGVFTTPLARFLDADAYEGRTLAALPEAEVERVVHYFRLPEGNVWGATGRMVAELLDLAVGWSPPRPPRPVGDVADFARDL